MTSPTRRGWPPSLPPPGAPQWRHRAAAHLLDACPPEYRGYPVVVRQPAVLGWLAVRHVHAAREAALQALAQARAQLHGVVPPAVIDDVVAVLEAETARLGEQLASVTEVATALMADARAARTAGG
ncbi:MAG: hypothetical protein U0Q15_18465 [Kineosporiaceae bacterium]